MSNSNNDDNDFSSILSLGIGVGVGVKSILENKTNKPKTSSIVLDPRSSIISKIQDINLSTGPHQFDKSIALKKLGLFEKVVKNNPDLIRNEWEAAIRATYPNPLEAKAFSSSSNIFDAIKMNVNNSSSILSHRAFNLFSRNVEKFIGLGLENTISPNLMKAPSFLSRLPSVNNLTFTPLHEMGSLSKPLEEINKALGGNLRAFHRGTPGQGEYLFRLAGEDRNLFNLPEVFAAPNTGLSSGLIRSGNSLDNIYAPGIFGIVDEGNNIAKEYTFAELKAKNMLDTIASRGLNAQHPDLYRSLNAASTEMMKFADYMEANLPGMPMSPETIYKSHQMTVLDSNLSPLKGAAKRELVKNTIRDRGSFSPAAAESRFSLFDERELYGFFGADVDTSRKPWQNIRQFRNETITNPTLGSEFDFLSSPAAVKEFQNGGARVKTLYLSDEQIFQMQKLGITIGDGELLLHDSMKEKLKSTRVKKVALFELNADVANKFMNRGININDLTEQLKFDPIATSGVLGRTPEGNILSATNAEIIGIAPDSITGLDKTTRNSLNLYLKETIEMSDTEKVFGGLKGMARFVGKDSYGALGEALRKVGVKSSDIDGVQAIARVSDIKDLNRQKQALASSFILENRKRGNPFNIQETLQDIQGMTSKSEVENYFASKGMSLLSLDNGGVGVTELNFGGMKSLTGAGNAARIDPRIFNLLEATDPGGLGSSITKDIIARTAAANPERVNISSELLKSLKSFNGEVSPGQGDFVLTKANLSVNTEVDRLLKEGGFLETGVPKVPHIYVPGYDSNPSLFPRLTDKGSVVDTSEVSKIFRNIISDAKSVAGASSRNMTSEQFLSNMSEKQTGYLTRIFQEAAITGHGAGSITRGQVPGSVALTNVSEVNTADQGAFARMAASHTEVPDIFQNRIVGIPKKYGLEMFASMEEIVGAAKIQGMKERFLKGDLVAGLVMRDPTIGPYSTQPALFKMIDHTGENILIQEPMLKTTLGGKDKYLQRSILTGLAADKDADTVKAFLLDSDIESNLLSQMKDSNSAFAATIPGYNDHAARMQLLKPKAMKGIDESLPLADRRAAEAAKLGMTKDEVGLLSTNLTKSRRAVVASNMIQEDKVRALSLLEWLEQQPISGKHLDVNKVLSGIFEQQMEAIKQGAQGNGNLLAGTIRDMMSGVENAHLTPLLDEGMELPGIGKVGGLRLNETTTNIARASMEMRALPTGSQLAASSKYTAPSRGASIGFDEIHNVVFANEIHSSSFASNMSRGVMADINKGLANTMNSIRPYAKPLALGALAAGVAAAVFTDPKEMVAPPSRSSSNDRQNMEIPGVTQQMGEPTASPVLQQKTTQLDTEGTERRKGFRVKIKSGNMSNYQRQNLAERINTRFNGSKVNVTVRDNRRSMNQQNLSDMIENS